METKSLCQTICQGIENDITNTGIKILYFIDEYYGCTTQTLISKLGIKKTNLAKETKKLELDGLIFSKKGNYNNRSVFYSLTQKGKITLNHYLENLDKVFHEQDIQLENCLDEILKYLNKKI